MVNKRRQVDRRSVILSIEHFAIPERKLETTNNSLPKREKGEEQPI
jgi:hypothetical protein